MDEEGRKSLQAILGIVAWLSLASQIVGQIKPVGVHYKVLPPATEHNLTLFPVIADTAFDTGNFLTLDEGIRSGQVIVTEISQPTGLIRPRPHREGILPWSEPDGGAQVNELALVNHSDHPLILLAGEIVTGGKQDRIVGRDRIIPGHSRPVSLDVFCVEPHRWRETSIEFGASGSSMAQPSVRAKAMADRNQQEVWNEVARSRAGFAAMVPGYEARTIDSSSSYAAAVENGAVKRQLEAIASPLEHSYEKWMQQLRAQHAVGAVIAVNRELIWVDLFASPSLLEKYWPKLIRSYAAEALTPRLSPPIEKVRPSQQEAQNFLDRFEGGRENIESEPGVYRNTEILGEDFDAFLLTSLLPNTGFNIHLAKMKR